jgi:two-component system cell cycle sensor histidine kinase/response regulator CckA
MGEKKSEDMQKRIERLKEENRSLRETAKSLKGESLKLRRSLRDRDMLFDSLPDGAVLIRNRNILEMNKALLDELGYQAEDVIGRDFLDFVLSEEVEYVKNLHNTWVSGKMATGQYDGKLLARDGKAVYCNVKVKRLRYQGRTTFLLTLTRLEKREAMEQEKIRSKKREALSSMALGLNSKLCRCNESLLRIKRDIIQNTSYSKTNLSEPSRMLEEVSHNTMLIARGLDMIAEREIDTKDMTSFDINEGINEAVASTLHTWKTEPEEKGLNIDLKTYLRSSEQVKGNPEDIKGVIKELITNSVEAMPHGGEIHITTEDNAGYVHIYIQDSGIGIEDTWEEKVFDPFFSTKGDPERGLGLTTVYAIIKRHKGNIQISSRAGEGTIFHIRLPLAKHEYKAKARMDREKLKDAQVLIVQEEDVARELLSHLLASKGCRVDTANSPLEGIGKLKRKRFDLVIADTETLLSGGSSIVKKYAEINPKISIALIGDAPNSNTYNLQDDLAVDLYFLKPLDIKRAIKKVSEFLMESD